MEGNFFPSLGGGPGYVDLLPTKEPGINRPSARTDHRQSHAERYKHDAHPSVGRMRYQDDHLDDGNYHSRHRRPQAKQQQQSSDGPDDLRDESCGRRRIVYMRDCRAKENDGRQKPLKKEAASGPAVGERREQALQEKSLPKGRFIGTATETGKSSPWPPPFGGVPCVRGPRQEFSAVS